MNDLTFRPARREDVPTIVKLLADDRLGSRRERYENPLPETYYTAFDKIDSNPNFELIVIEREGEVIGTLQLMYLPSISFQGGLRAQIEAVRVDERFRNQGIGQKFIEWTIARARERGCFMVQLTTNNDRADAHRFYERLGFVSSHIGMKLNLHRDRA
jgi:GNAT superfamily N-acetyltransferase